MQYAPPPIHKPLTGNTQASNGLVSQCALLLVTGFLLTAYRPRKTPA